MSASPSTEEARPAPAPPEALAALDLFALGRQATAARDAPDWSAVGARDRRAVDLAAAGGGDAPAGQLTPARRPRVSGR